MQLSLSSWGCSCVVWVALKNSSVSTLLSENSAKQVWVSGEDAEK